MLKSTLVQLKLAETEKPPSGTSNRDDMEKPVTGSTLDSS